MIEQGVRVDLYKITVRAVEEGVSRALNRATKYAEWSHWETNREGLSESVAHSVMGELCEVIQFGEPEP